MDPSLRFGIVEKAHSFAPTDFFKPQKKRGLIRADGLFRLDLN